MVALEAPLILAIAVMFRNVHPNSRTKEKLIISEVALFMPGGRGSCPGLLARRKVLTATIVATSATGQDRHAPSDMSGNAVVRATATSSTVDAASHRVLR